MTESNLVRTLAAKVAAGAPAAMITVTGTEGSAPREPGAKMLVFPDGACEGTIGGGRLEAQAVSDALAALAEGRPRRSRYELEPKALGMYCGGSVEVFIDVFRESLKLVILGGGHVGRKTAELAALLSIPHWIADDRAEYADPQRFPHARQVLAEAPEAALAGLAVDSDTAIAIVTRCHGADLRCLTAALGTEAFYIGMIGSRAKTDRLFELCRRRGLQPESDSRVRAPIGLDLGVTTPEGIALSILSEILAVRHGASARPLSRETVPAGSPA